tara:strand:- start:2036 stop:4018 length:1983 start_codon:yes stop_codon:yes gene_type:complete
MKFYKLIFLLSVSFNIFAVSVDTGHAKVSLVKYNFSENGVEHNLIGIKMDMQKNWHTYWKNPGDSGGPIKVKWSHEENLVISDIFWPTPSLIPYDPLMTYGYKDFVIFPFKLENSGNSNAPITANIDFLICDDICVPEKAYIETTIDEIVADINLQQWFAEVPTQTLPAKVSLDNEHIEIRFSNNDLLGSAIFFINDADIVEHASEQVLIKEENNWLLKIKKLQNIKQLNNISGVLAFDNGDAFIIDAEIETTSSSSSNINFIQAIIFAFVGGLILNLMPCVFPIISLKVLSFVSMSNQSASKIRAHALSFCAGVIISFLLIGFALILLKQTGAYLGWGFQLQSPLIVGALCILMFVIGIILLSDINIGSSLTRYGGVGSSNSITGSFLTGVLAVIVASPCTAPFMGAALGYALIQPSGVTLPVFASLGVGFASPYLILSMAPGLINYLPKPGNWMVTLKEFFAFPMFATALWLMWVFSLQTGPNDIITLLITILLISLLIWIYLKLSNRGLKIIILLSMILLMFYQLKSFSLSEPRVQESQASQDNADYVLWESDIEERFKKDKQAYLINFTAAWCITCQANDKIAISRPSVKNYLKTNNIEYVVADWTNKDRDILLALELYKRNGVPLYIFWKPGMNESKILPAILTEQILLDSFNNS